MEAGGGSRSGITASTTPERAPPADSVRSRTPSAATSQGPSGAAMVYHHAKRVPPLLWCKQSSDRCVSPAFLASTPQALDGSVTCESVNMPKNSRKIRAVIACMCIRQSEVVFVVFIVGQHNSVSLLHPCHLPHSIHIPAHGSMLRAGGASAMIACAAGGPSVRQVSRCRAPPPAVVRMMRLVPLVLLLVSCDHGARAQVTTVDTRLQDIIVDTFEPEAQVRRVCARVCVRACVRAVCWACCALCVCECHVSSCFPRSIA